MWFGMIVRMGPWMRQVVGPREGVILAANEGLLIVTSGEFAA